MKRTYSLGVLITLATLQATAQGPSVVTSTNAIFKVDQDGNRSLLHSIAVSTTANGVAIVSSGL